MLIRHKIQLTSILWLTIPLILIWRYWVSSFVPLMGDSIESLYKPALYLYQGHFASFYFPDNFVNEMPLLHEMLALLWKVTGVNLWSIHLFVTFFILGTAYHLIRLAKELALGELQIWLSLLALSEASWVGLTLHPYLDHALLCWFLWSIRSYRNKRQASMSIALLFLGFTSIRGILSVIGIGGAVVLLESIRAKEQGLPRGKELARAFGPFLPVSLLLIAFWVGHRICCGYFYFSPENLFATHRQLLGTVGIARNLVVMLFRLVDNGRLVLWMALALLLLFKRKDLWRVIRENRFLFVMASSLFAVMLPFTLPFSNPFHQRYFLPSFFLLILLVGISLWSLLPKRRARLAIITILVCLWASHLVVYPLRISQAFDATLAVLPYFGQVDSARSFFKKRKIPFSKVGFDRGDCRPFNELHTNDPDLFHDHDFSKNDYMVLSRVQNPDDGYLDTLWADFDSIADLSRCRLKMILYERKGLSNRRPLP
ncbi:MAG TPA: hypothetical protein VLM37_07070 [Fibrobacteraceae bacterium]|nr:hypothetical protein [Fibrobacteraceae bacterium]